MRKVERRGGARKVVHVRKEGRMRQYASLVTPFPFTRLRGRRFFQSPVVSPLAPPSTVTVSAN